MTTYTPRAHVRWPHVNLWLVAVVGLAAALIGLGAWVLVDRYTGGGGATHDATTLIDNGSAAWNTGDGNAAATFYTNNAVIDSLGDTAVGPKAIGQAMVTAHAMQFHVERVAPVTVNGDFATSWFKITGVGIDRYPVLTVFQVKDGKILRQWGFGVGLTEPFINAVMP